MGQVYVAANKVVNGPWLLGKNELEELDSVFMKIEKQIEESSKENLEYESNSDVEKGYSKDVASAKKRNEKGYTIKKKVTLISTDETKLIDKSIKGLLKDPRLKDFNPKELHYEVASQYNNSFSLTVERKFQGELSYKASCFSQNAQEEIKYEIETWIDKFKPNKVKQYWCNSFPILPVFVFMILIFAVTFQININSVKVEHVYKKEIYSILDSGVNNTNQAKAIELILKLNSEYFPKNYKYEPTFRIQTMRTIVLGVILILIFSLRPRTTIGVGKKKSELTFYRYYIPFIFITIPSLFIFPFIIGWIKFFFGI